MWLSGQTVTAPGELAALGLPGYLLGAAGAAIAYLYRNQLQAQREQVTALRTELDQVTKELSEKNREIQEILLELARQKSSGPVA